MTAHANAKILVRIGQFNAATHGEASLHESQPSAHGKHSNVFALLYNDNETSPYFFVKFFIFISVVAFIIEYFREGSVRC